MITDTLFVMTLSMPALKIGKGTMDIQIRKFKSEDAAEFLIAVKESVVEVGRWLPWCHEGYTIDDAVEWAESAEDHWQSDTDYRFIIEQTGDRRILGSVGINQIVRAHGIGNLGYWVRTSSTRCGVCSSAARQLVTLAFAELGFSRIEIHMLVDNVASARVAVKIGASYEGTLRNKIKYNGMPMSARTYSIIPSDYGY